MIACALSWEIPPAESTHGKEPFTASAFTRAMSLPIGVLISLCITNFDKKSGNRVTDLSAHGADLEIPTTMKLLTMQFLSTKSEKKFSSWKGIGDLCINLLGFIPFGLVVSARANKRSQLMPSIWVAVFSGLLLSLAIETAQMWIPSRSSDLFDLAMNTPGAAAGGAIFGTMGRTWSLREKCICLNIQVDHAHLFGGDTAEAIGIGICGHHKRTNRDTRLKEVPAPEAEGPIGAIVFGPKYAV